MNKFFIALIYTCICLGSLSLIAQQKNKLTIQGTVLDSLNQPMAAATVFLLEPIDSTMASYTYSDQKGFFKLAPVVNKDYIVKINYLGHLPYEKPIKGHSSPEIGDVIDLGKIILRPIDQQLFEVIIKEARAPMMIKGDTIEYDASKFKVPPGATVEDLLRRLPGVDVGSDGSVSSEGKDVTKVTVDGKRFFSDDPKMATKNLPAEGVSKVQIFDQKIENKDLQSNSASSAEKTMNLEMKEEYKKGQFGKITAGIGTKKTWELKGNANRFDKKYQLGVIANANNTGRNGLGWNDYSDFTGSNSFNMGDQDFGFDAQNNGMLFIINDDADELESSLRSSFSRRGSRGGGQGSGFPHNYTSGINLNYNPKKTELNTVYLYNNNQLESATDSKSTKQFSDSQINTTDQAMSDNKKQNHRLQFSTKTVIDSTHTINFESVFLHTNTNNIESSAPQTFNENNELVSSSFYDNHTEKKGNGILNKFSYILSPKKDKWDFGLRLVQSYQTIDNNLQNQSKLSTYVDSLQSFATDSLLQEISKGDIHENYRGSAMFAYKIAKNINWKTFTNINYIRKNTENEVFSKTTENLPFVADSLLTRNFELQVLRSRLGSGFTYSKDGLGITIGMAAIQIRQIGDFKQPLLAMNQNLRNDKTFYFYTPHLSLGWEINRQTTIDAGYDYSITEAPASKLQPFLNNTNPLRTSIGNPNLSPEKKHTIKSSLWMNRPAKFFNFNLTVTASKANDAIINYETVSENLATHVLPINGDGVYAFSIYNGMGFPIIKSKLTGNFWNNLNFTKSYAYVNNEKNTTMNQSISIALRLNYTIGDIATISSRINISPGQLKYDNAPSQNQKTLNQEYALELNTRIIKRVYFNSSFNYEITQNDRYGLRNEIPILNSSIYMLLLKGNKAEIRFSAYDMLDKRRDVQQNSSINEYSYSTTPTLSRYFMVSASYNIHGIEANVKKGRNRF